MKNVGFVRAGVIATAGAALLVAGGGQSVSTPISPGDLGAVPERTAITFTDSHTGRTVGTGNQHEPHAGLSTVKLYMADHVINHGDGSAADHALAEAMIRDSDDGAATQLYAKYPDSINGPAGEYGLANTHGAGHWGNSTTSTADTVKFLEAKKTADPGSPILHWMRTATPVAADGTLQNWGTSNLPGAEGTKWGWSDYGPRMVNSATISAGYSVASATDGTGHDQTADVRNAFTPAVPDC